MATPEGVTLEVTLAGVGSRFVAGLIDQVLRWSVLLALVALLAILEEGVGGRPLRRRRGGDHHRRVLRPVRLRRAVRDAGVGPHAREALDRPAGGEEGRDARRLPGQRPAQHPAHRRLPARLLPGRHPQRDVHRQQPAPRRPGRRHDRRAGAPPVHRPARRRPRPAPAPADSALYDVSAVSAEELATVRRFLDRRATLTPEARDRLAREMATRLGPKVVGPPRQWEPEAFLEYLVAAKAARG